MKIDQGFINFLINRKGYRYVYKIINNKALVISINHLLTNDGQWPIIRSANVYKKLLPVKEMFLTYPRGLVSKNKLNTLYKEYLKNR